MINNLDKISVINNLDIVNLKELLQSITQKIEKKNILVRPYCDSSLLNFNSLNSEQKNFIFQQLNSYNELLVEIIGLNTFSKEISNEDEVSFAKLALKKFGLKCIEEDYSFIAKGDIVEIYSSEMCQLYRNLEFFRQCSYDILTLVSYEWPTLYERSNLVTNQIFSRAMYIMNESPGLEPFMVPEHTLRERYIDAKNVFSVQLKSLMPLLDVTTNQRKGALNTLTSKLILENAEADKLAHI